MKSVDAGSVKLLRSKLINFGLNADMSPCFDLQVAAFLILVKISG